MKHGCSILRLAPPFNSLSQVLLRFMFFGGVFKRWSLANMLIFFFGWGGLCTLIMCSQCLFGRLVLNWCTHSVSWASYVIQLILTRLNCSTQAIFPVTIFVDFRIFKRLFLHISTNSWPCAPPHTWLATILLYTTPTLGYFFLQLICPSSACPSVWVWKSLLSDLTQSLPIKPAG